MSRKIASHRFPHIIAAVVLLAAAASCGDDDNDGAAATSAATSTISSPGTVVEIDDPTTTSGAADVTYPVTITHRLGTAVIEEAPQRVVTLGYGDEDAVAALGVIPVGSLNYDVNSFSPWFDSARGTTEGTPIDVLDGFPMEQIAELEPDLIVVMGNDVSESDYALLSAMAPTIAYQNEPFLDSWQNITSTLGDALGVPDRAAQVIADADAALVAAADAHPEWAGKTFAVAVVMSPDEIGVLVSPEENTVRLLTGLGMQLAPGAAGLELGPTGFSAFISREQIAVLDADVLVIREGAAGLQDTMEADPLFQSLQVSQNGNVIWADADMWSAFRSPSVLAIPYALDRLVPLVEGVEP